MRHIGKLPVSYLEKQHSGDVLSRINNDLQLIQQFMIRDLAQWFYILEVDVHSAHVRLGFLRQPLQLLADPLGNQQRYGLSGMLSRSYQVLLQLTAQKKLAVKKREAWVNPLLFWAVNCSSTW
jgi:ATP-binding cassette subfamily B protein